MLTLMEVTTTPVKTNSDKSKFWHLFIVTLPVHDILHLNLARPNELKFWHENYSIHLQHGAQKIFTISESSTTRFQSHFHVWAVHGPVTLVLYLKSALLFTRIEETFQPSFSCPQLSVAKLRLIIIYKVHQIMGLL